jgi:hypothetical protein
MLAIAKIAKNRKVYYCESCDYNTSNIFDFNKHTKTKKHSQSGLSMAIDDFSIFCDKKIATKVFKCSACNKVYKDNSGLWKHKKKCAQSQEDGSLLDNKLTDLTSQITPELVLNVLQQNKELTDLVVEQNKTIMEMAKTGQTQAINTLNSINSINSNNVNSNNKTFNLNVFLNETCKDAMNITDFVDSLQLQLSDLENVGKVGFVEGISNIIVKNLQALDVHKRPVHCADKKREVLYIKDEDKWERDSEEKNKMRNVIKKVVFKNQRLLPKFKEAHPGCNFSESKYSDHYSKLVIEAMGGYGNNETEKEDKIIKNIAKEVVIDKKEFGLQ